MISAGLITPVPPKAPPGPLPTWYDPNARCEYHMQGRGHWTYGELSNLIQRSKTHRFSLECIY